MAFGMLTVFSDASYCHQTGAGGWGAWAKREEWPQGMSYGGRFRKLLTCSNEAETYAVANALHRLRATKSLEGLNTIMIQSDSMVALRLILNNIDGAEESLSRSVRTARVQNGAMSPNEFQAVALDEIRRALVGARLKVLVRHVKGHKAGGGRNWVNRRCDEIAREHMMSWRAELGSCV